MGPRLPLALLACSACYAELGGAYYPSVREHTAGTADTSSQGVGVSFKLGFYLDVPLPWLRSAVGVGLAPAGTAPRAILPSEGARLRPHADELRIDAGLPWLIAHVLLPRLTFAYHQVTYAQLPVAGTDDSRQVDAEGSGWFVGGSLSAHGSGSTLIATLGVEHDAMTIEPGLPTARDGTATGVGLRVMVAWTPTGRWMRYYTPSPTAPAPTGGGCYDRTTCDVDGHCTSSYYCP